MGCKRRRDSVGHGGVNWRGGHFCVHLIHCYVRWSAIAGGRCVWGWGAVLRPPVNGNMNLVKMFHPSREPQRWAERLSPPVITPKQQVELSPPSLKKHLPVSTLTCNCSPPLTGLPASFTFCNYGSLFTHIVSKLVVFVRLHNLATQTFFCPGSQAVCVHGGWI